MSELLTCVELQTSPLYKERQYLDYDWKIDTDMPQELRQEAKDQIAESGMRIINNYHRWNEDEIRSLADGEAVDRRVFLRHFQQSEFEHWSLGLSNSSLRGYAKSIFFTRNPFLPYSVIAKRSTLNTAKYLRAEHLGQEYVTGEMLDFPSADESTRKVLLQIAQFHYGLEALNSDIDWTLLNLGAKSEMINGMLKSAKDIYSDVRKINRAIKPQEYYQNAIWAGHGGHMTHFLVKHKSEPDEAGETQMPEIVGFSVKVIGPDGDNRVDREIIVVDSEDNLQYKDGVQIVTGHSFTSVPDVLYGSGIGDQNSLCFVCPDIADKFQYPNKACFDKCGFENNQRYWGTAVLIYEKGNYRVDWISVEDVRRALGLPEPEPFVPRYRHDASVDHNGISMADKQAFEREFGVSLEEYVRKL